MRTTKLLTCLLITIILNSCEKKADCEFSNLSITTIVDEKKIDEKSYNDCYSIRKLAVGRYVIEGKQTSDKFSIRYDDDNSKDDSENRILIPSKTLNANIDGKKTEWGNGEGNFIMQRKQDTLFFILFGRENKTTKIGVLFTK